MSAMIQDYNLPTLDLSYPAVSLDSQFGSSFQIVLYRTQLVKDYIIGVVQGTLGGGTTPVWATSATKPIITHVKVEANNNVIYDVDMVMAQFLETWASNQTADGLNFRIRIADFDLRTQKIIEATGLPSWSFNQILMTLTVASLSSETSGGATTSTGTTLYLTEESAPRASVKFQPLLVKHLQVTQTLASGLNDLTSFLSQDGAYSSILMYSDTGSSGYSAASDTNITRLSLILNSTNKVRDSWWTGLKAQNKSVTGYTTSTGVAVWVFKDGFQASKLLSLKNTQLVTNVDVQLTTGATGLISILKTEYF